MGLNYFVYIFTFLLRLLHNAWIMKCFSDYANFVIVGSEVKLVPSLY